MIVGSDPCVALTKPELLFHFFAKCDLDLPYLRLDPIPHEIV